jgi:uncharacterized protein (DUF1330 family)
MAAYVISEVKARDSTLFDAYRKLASASIEKYGGRYVVRGGKLEVVEGGPEPKAMIVVEFPSMARAKEWYASPEYAAALKVRNSGALERRLIFVEGV